MTDLKKGARVTVNLRDGRSPFNGTITGEGRSGHWWFVLKDGNKHANGYHKDFCQPEAVTDEGWDEMSRRAKNCTYGNPDCQKCNPHS